MQQTGKTSAGKLINVAKGVNKIRNSVIFCNFCLKTLICQVHDKKQRLSMSSVAEIGENGSSTAGSNTSVEDSVF